jgi:hypothetical protein
MSYNYRTPTDDIRTTDNGIIVKRTRILSTQCVAYSAWERGDILGAHQTITTIDGVWYGTLHSRRDDSSYAHLRGGSDERIAAVRAAYAANDAESYAAIVLVFPEAVDGKRSDGDIEVYY